MPALSEDKKNKLIEIGAALFISVAIYLVSHTTPFQRLELLSLDARFNLRPPIATNSDIATIDIDDKALQEEGRWQDWTRDKHARIVDVIRHGSGSLIGFDIYFSEESEQILRPTDIAEAGTLEDVVAAFRDYDAELAAAAKRANNVFWGSTFSLDERNGEDDPSKSANRGASRLSWESLGFLIEKGYCLQAEKRSVEGIVRASSPEAIPFRALIEVANGVGFAQIVKEADGVVRKYPTFIRCDYPPGEDSEYTYLFPSIGLAMACEYLQVRVANLILKPGEYLEIPNAFLPDSSKSNIKIPVNAKGEMIINWAGDYKDVFRHFPYSSLTRLAEAHTLSGIKEFISQQDPSIFQNPPELMTAVAHAFPRVRDYATYVAYLYGAYWYEVLLEENQIKAFEPPIFTELFGLLPDDDPSLYEDQREVFERVRINHAIFDMLSEKPGISASEAAEILGATEEDSQNSLTTMQRLAGKGGPTAADLPLYFLSPVIVDGKEITIEDLRGGIFFYGLTASGTHDLNPMPFNPRYPMVGALANVFNTIVTDQFIAPMPARWRLPLFLALGLLSGYILSTRTTIRGSFFTILLLVAYLLLAYELFAVRGIWIDVVGPAAIVILSDVVIVWYKFNAAEKKRKFIRSAFEQYMNPAVVEQIAKNPEMLELGGKEMVLTAFFSDVAGFTTISEKLTPHELVELLNEYLTAMTDIVLDHLGLLDKYEGDAIMAVFGAPIHSPDHAAEACYTALEMQTKLCELREKWKAEGKPELTARIGLNTGPMIVGNMGSKKRFDYTVMGDAVNLASRLEGVNKQYSTDIMISEFTLEQCKEDVVVREIDLIRVKGKAEPVRIYEVLGRSDDGLPEEMKSIIEHYSAGLEAYRLREWEDGIKAFQQALEIKPDDGPSLTYLKRCEGYSAAPPPDDWDGVYVMTTK